MSAASGSGSGSQQRTLLPTAPPSPPGLDFDDLVSMDAGGIELFDPQFELPDSWGMDGAGGGGMGMPGEYEDFNPIPPPVFSPLPFTQPEPPNPTTSDFFHQPQQSESDQLTTSLFSTFESSALSSFLTSTLGEPAPPTLPPVPPAAASSSSFKRSSASVFAGLVKARGAWDFNPVLPAGLPSWRKVGEGVHGVPGLSGLERMRISNGETVDPRGRHPGEIGSASGALEGWPAVKPADLHTGGAGRSHSHTPVAGSSGRTSAGTRRPSFTSNTLPSGSTRRPSSTSRKRSTQPPPPSSSNTSGSTPSASTPVTLPDQDTLMSEPRSTGARGDDQDGLVDGDQVMREVVRVAGDHEDDGEDEVEEDEMSDGSGAYEKGKGKGKRPARSAPTPTPPPSTSTRSTRGHKHQSNPSLPPPPPPSMASSSRANAKRPKHDVSSATGPPPPQPLRRSPPPDQSLGPNLPSLPPPAARSNRQASVVSTASSTTTAAKQEPADEKPGGASYGRGLLTAKEKRENHILSEQKRRNAIRNSYTDLSLILSSSTLASLPPLLCTHPELAQPISSNTGKRGAAMAKVADAGGRGGSKSSVLGKAVGLVKWLGEGNDWLEKECERLAALVGGDEGGLVDMRELEGQGHERGVKMET